MKLLKNHKQTAENVSVKYNGNQLDTGSKYALFIDWLTLNLEGKPNFNSDLITVEHADYGTQQFENRCNISFKGVEFCSLVYNNRLKNICPDLCQIKLSNHLFYMFTKSQIYTYITELLEVLNLSFTSINRLDIALDFNENQHDVKGLLKKMFNEQVLISGREKDFDIFTATKKGKINLNGFRLGSRKSARFLRVYNKTQEQEKNIKTYIFDAWQKIGLISSDNNPIWRYEYQLTNKFFRDLEGLTLKALLTENGIFNVLKTATANHFELKHNTGKKETNKEKDYNFINWLSVGRSLGVITGTISKVKRIIKETLIGQKRLVKSLLRSYFSKNQRLEYILPLKLTLNDFELWDWFAKKLPFYLEEFKKQQIIKLLDRNKFRNDLQIEI